MFVNNDAAEDQICSAINISDNVEILKSLFNELAGNDISKQQEMLLAKNAYGLTPLRVAVENNRTKIVKFLLSILSEVDKEPLLLHIAAERNYLEVIKLLISHGWDSEETDDDGNTPLLIAAASNSFEAFKVLHVIKRDSLMIQNKFGYTVLHASIAANSINIIKYLQENYHEEMKKICLIKTSKGDTALHSATMSGNINILKLIMNYFQYVNIENECTQIPLRLAIIRNFKEGVEVLIKKGATQNLTIYQRKRLFYGICHQRSVDSMKLFCDDLKLQCPKHDEFYDILQDCFIYATRRHFHEYI